MTTPISPVLRDVSIHTVPQRLSDDYELPTPRRAAQPGMIKSDSARPPESVNESIAKSLAKSMPDATSDATSDPTLDPMPEPTFEDLVASGSAHSNAPEPVLTSDEIRALLADQD